MARNGFNKLGEGLSALKDAVGPVAGAGASLGKGTAKAGTSVAGGAAATGAGIVGTVLKVVGDFAKKHPRITFVVAAYGALKGIQSFIRKRNDKQEAAALNAAPAGIVPQQTGYEASAAAQEFGAAFPTEPVAIQQGTGHDYSQAAPTLTQPQQVAQPEAQGPDLTPEERQAFIEALMAASSQQQGPKTQGPADFQQDAEPQPQGWTQKVDASRQPQAQPQQTTR